MPGQFQPLRLPPGKRRHRLPQAQIIQPDLGERRESGEHLGLVGEEFHRLMHRQVEHVGHRFAAPAQFEDFRAITLAAAIRAAQPHVGEELHLDVLETGAGAGRAAPVSGVEAERAGAVAARLRFRQRGEQLADGVPRADVAHRVGARAFADGRLVDHHHAGQGVHAVEALERAGLLDRLPEMSRQRRIEHVANQRRFAGAGNAGQAHQPPQREGDGESGEVVLARADEGEQRRVGIDRARPARGGDAFCPRQPRPGNRARVGGDFRRAAARDDLAAALARAGADFEQFVGGQHHLRVVFDHHQRVAGVAQPRHHAEDAPHVARVQSDGRLVEHEQRVHQRSAERGGEVDALHLAAGERARLAVEGEIAESDIDEIVEPRANLAEDERASLVGQFRQVERGEQGAGFRHRQGHQFVDGEVL